MIVLASASKTRAEILQKFKIPFVQKPLDFDEDAIKTSDPEEFVWLCTLGKFKNACAQEGFETPILVADTVVSAGGTLQRKAKSVSEARTFLQAQSGREIKILTCMIYKSKKLEFNDLSSTQYVFNPFDAAKLRAYLDSGSWRGKAGCVMVEGFHGDFAKSVRGLESTALGLSVEKLLPFLETT